MTDAESSQLDAFSVDIRDLLARTVADLYSHLVTRPTGRAVRLAIESGLDEIGRPALSLVDFSSVAILDYSCADEVVAKLVLSLRDGPGAGRGWVLFRGVRDFHRDPIEAVLDRHRIRAVMEGSDGTGELMGPADREEIRIWSRVEEAGHVAVDEIPELLARGPDDAARLDGLLSDRLLYRHPFRGDLIALSRLSRDLASPPSASQPRASGSAGGPGEGAPESVGGRGEGAS